MATDIRLDDGDGTFIVLDARVLKTTASDLVLDSPERHTGGAGLRRALVHDQRDGLTLNFNGDYPGGVAINGRTINLNGPAGERITMDESGKIGAADRMDQVTIHATIISLDTMSADGNSAGDVRFTFQRPDELDQDGNPRVAGFPEMVSLGALLMQLRDEISLLKSRITKLEGK